MCLIGNNDIDLGPTCMVKANLSSQDITFPKMGGADGQLKNKLMTGGFFSESLKFKDKTKLNESERCSWSL